MVHYPIPLDDQAQLLHDVEFCRLQLASRRAIEFLLEPCEVPLRDIPNSAGHPL
jgi:hypothetical protein